MKPLKIEQLKALEAGDWVWIVDKEHHEKTYAKFSHDYHYFGKPTYAFETAGYNLHLYEEDYNVRWFVYENKEQAEAKGEIIELPCLRGIPDFVDNDGKHTKMKELDYMEMGRIYSIPYVEGQFEEAERRLAELKGEEK